ncbi:MAG: hypothetical protein H6Q20_1294 [Bacteroidetes bacterium]|nr:hypothetical protein [Bacteroidota bacterium]
MNQSNKSFSSVDEYLTAQPENVRPLLEEIRHIIRSTVPNAVETISYGMPAYKVHGVLVYFAANKNHIGFYPTGSPIEVFKEDLSAFKTSKGAIQFPLQTGVPADLVKKITLYRLREDEEKFLMKAKK